VSEKQAVKVKLHANSGRATSQSKNAVQKVKDEKRKQKLKAKAVADRGEKKEKKPDMVVSSSGARKIIRLIWSKGGEWSPAC